jgi:hypothetical protein
LLHGGIHLDDLDWVELREMRHGSEYLATSMTIPPLSGKICPMSLPKALEFAVAGRLAWDIHAIRPTWLPGTNRLLAIPTN